VFFIVSLLKDFYFSSARKFLEITEKTAENAELQKKQGIP